LGDLLLERNPLLPLLLCKLRGEADAFMIVVAPGVLEEEEEEEERFLFSLVGSRSTTPPEYTDAPQGEPG
jgi:hypothetical protein